MYCKEIQKMIVPFHKKELSVSDEEKFVDHIEQCPDCREELEIHYIIEYGLGDGDEETVEDIEEAGLIEYFDFKGLVDYKIGKSNKRIEIFKIYNRIMVAFVFATDVFMILTIIWWMMSQL